MAIAMMFGAVAATALTLVAVPLLYFEFFKQKTCPLVGQTGEPCDLAPAQEPSKPI